MKNILITVMSILLISSLIMAQEEDQNLGNSLKKDTPNKIGVTQGSVKGPNQITAVVSYDFTTGSGQYYGGDDACVDLSGTGAGPWAMIAGDTDGSGVIDAADRSNTWNDRNQTGYLGSDVNLSGVTDAGDRSTTWNNRNKSTEVPN